MNIPNALILAVGLSLGAPALAAKHAKPAATADTPADTTAAPASAGGDTTGTTIVGDQEAPIGLFITPWKNDYAEHSLDRPARFVDDELVPIDPDVFHREIKYDAAIAAHRKEQLSKDH